ncbi:hypothetical protein B296_00057045, partial [Ensete ventricosum]
DAILVKRSNTNYGFKDVSSVRSGSDSAALCAIFPWLHIRTRCDLSDNQIGGRIPESLPITMRKLYVVNLLAFCIFSDALPSTSTTINYLALLMSYKIILSKICIFCMHFSLIFSLSKGIMPNSLYTFSVLVLTA